jgi:hypothetical protein
LKGFIAILITLHYILEFDHINVSSITLAFLL